MGTGFQSRRWLSPSPIIQECDGTPQRFRFLPQSVKSSDAYLNLNKFPNEGRVATSRLALPPSLLLPSCALVHPLPCSSVTLSFSRWRCRKSRVHFPHFSPSWRAASTTVKGWDAEKKLHERVAMGGGQAEELYFPGVRNFPFKTRRPASRCRQRERHFTTLLRAYPRNYFPRLHRSRFEQFYEQIATFYRINPEL